MYLPVMDDINVYPLCFFLTPQQSSGRAVCVCFFLCVSVHTTCQAILAWPPRCSQGVENISPVTIDNYPELPAPSAAQRNSYLQWPPPLLILCPTASCLQSLVPEIKEHRRYWSPLLTEGGEEGGRRGHSVKIVYPEKSPQCQLTNTTHFHFRATWG